MTPAQMFGVAVRAIGLLVALGSGWTFLYGLIIAGSARAEAGWILLEITVAVVVIQLLIGLCLMRWPNWLVAFAYPQPWKPGALAADRVAGLER